MKKLITMLSALTLTVTTSAAVVACSEEKNPSEPPYTLSKLHGLKLDLGDLSGELNGPGSFKTPIAEKFLELNSDILIGIKPSDLYVATASIDVANGTAVVTGTNKGENITFEEGDGVTVKFKAVASEATKLKDIEGLILEIGEVKSVQFYDVAKKFVEVNSSVLPSGLTTSNATDQLYVSVNTTKNTAKITGKNGNTVGLSTISSNGVTISFTVPDSNAKTNINSISVSLTSGQTQAAATSAITNAIQQLSSETSAAVLGVDFEISYQESATSSTVLDESASLAANNIAVVTALDTSKLITGTITLTVK